MPMVLDATRPRQERAAVAQRIRAEFEEMPGLALTLAQAARLWGEPVAEIERLLLLLVREGFLMRGPGGRYRRTGCPRCS